MKAKHWGLLLIVTLAAAGGCGKRISGTYVDAAGISTYVFETDGRARISALGAEVSAEYRIDGDSVILNSPQGTLVLTIRGDRLIGPMGLDLIRKTATEEP